MNRPNLLQKPVAKAPPKKAAAVPKKLAQSTLKTKPAPKKRAKPESDDEDLATDDVSGYSNTPPKAKKQKSAAPVRKKAGKPLAEIENDSIMEDEPSAADAALSAAPKSNKSATETYQKLTPRQHILTRPDTYIGSVEKTEQQMWVFNKETKLMEFRQITFVPGLYKIFDEILVNAADNKQRDGDGYTMTYLKVSVDRAAGEITVENNGKGIPIVVHEVCGTLNSPRAPS